MIYSVQPNSQYYIHTVSKKQMSDLFAQVRSGVLPLTVETGWYFSGFIQCAVSMMKKMSSIEK